MNDKLLGLLGIARRGSNLAIGFEMCSEAVEKNRAKLIIVASDTAQRTEKELKFKTNGKDIEAVRISADKYSLSRAIGTSAGAVALCDEGFAKRASELINQGGN